MVTFSFQKAISEALNHLAQTHGMRPIELITEDSVVAFAKELFASVSPDQFKAKDLEMLDSLKTRLHQAESAHVSRGEAGPSENGLVGQIDQMITLLRARSLPVKDKPSDGQAQTASSTSGEKRTLFENLPGELQAKVASGVSLNTRRALALTSHMGYTASLEASEQVLAELVAKLGSIDDSFVGEMKTLQGSGDLEKIREFFHQFDVFLPDDASLQDQSQLILRIYETSGRYHISFSSAISALMKMKGKVSDLTDFDKDPDIRPFLVGWLSDPNGFLGQEPATGQASILSKEALADFNADRQEEIFSLFKDALANSDGLFTNGDMASFFDFMENIRDFTDESSKLEMDLQSYRELLMRIHSKPDSLRKHPELFNCKGAMRMLSCCYPNVLSVASQANEASGALTDNFEFMKSIVKHFGVLLKFASAALKDDERLVRLALAVPAAVHERFVWSVQSLSSPLSYASARLKANRALVILAVSRDPQSFEFADEKFRNDPEIFKIAAQQSIDSVKYAGERILRDKELIFYAMAQQPEQIIYCRFWDRPLRELIYEILYEHPELLTKVYESYLEEPRIGDVDIASISELLFSIFILESPSLFEKLPLIIRNDRAIALDSVSLRPENIFFVSDKLLQDRDFLDAVKERCPQALDLAIHALLEGQDYDKALSSREALGLVADKLSEPLQARARALLESTQSLHQPVEAFPEPIQSVQKDTPDLPLDLAQGRAQQLPLDSRDLGELPAAFPRISVPSPQATGFRKRIVSILTGATSAARWTAKALGWMMNRP